MAMRRGRFFGGGGGFGRGRGQAFYGTPAAPAAAPVEPIAPQPFPVAVPYNENVELDAMRSQARALETALSGILKRIEALEAQKAEEAEHT